MPETIDESVSVNLLSNALKHSAFPSSLYWRGRRYQIAKVGLHHTTHDGRTLVHIFSVTDGTTSFKLSFRTDDLTWRLVETEVET